MKNRSTGKHHCFLPVIFDDNEIEVSNILLDLHNLLRLNEFSSFKTWGTKKRRSNRATATGFVSSSPSLQGSSKVDYYNEIKAAEVTSPATPLSFSPSESDDKSKHSSRKFSKRKTREELMDVIKQLSQCRDSLRGEVENVRNFYNNQKAYNFKLKSMKEQVTRRMNTQGPSIVLGQLYKNHQQPFIMDQIALASETVHRFQYPLGHLQQAQSMLGLGFVNHTGPIGIPDLNVTAEENFTVDSASFELERKAQFAAARRRRMIKRIEIKSASGLIRPRRR